VPVDSTTTPRPRQPLGRALGFLLLSCVWMRWVGVAVKGVGAACVKRQGRSREHDYDDLAACCLAAAAFFGWLLVIGSLVNARFCPTQSLAHSLMFVVSVYAT